MYAADRPATFSFFLLACLPGSVIFKRVAPVWRTAMDDFLERDDAESLVLRNPRPAQLIGLAGTTLSFLLCLGVTAAGLNWPIIWVVPLLVGLAGAAAAAVIAPRSPVNLAWAGAAAAL